MLKMPAAIMAVLAACACVSHARAAEIYGPSLPEPAPADSPERMAADPPRPMTPDQRRTFRQLQAAKFTLHAIDVAQTCHVVGNGGREINPVYAIPFGEHPKCYEVAIGKLVTAGLSELLLRRVMRSGDWKAVKRSQLITIGVMSATVTWNFTQF